MPMWATRPVTEQPRLTLTQWRLMRLADGDQHLVGFCVENREGRVTSAMQSIDIDSMCAVTSTGRIFRLIGPPGEHPEAEYVWGRWRRMYDIETWADVSDEVWKPHLAAKVAARLGSAG